MPPKYTIILKTGVGASTAKRKSFKGERLHFDALEQSYKIVERGIEYTIKREDVDIIERNLLLG